MMHCYPLNFQQRIKDLDEVENDLRACMGNSAIDILRKDLRSLGKVEWIAWMSRYSGLVAEFLAAPPGVRFSQPEWNAIDLRLRLLAAAIHSVRCAREMLTQVDRYCLFPWAGGSTRDFAVRASRAIDALYGYADVYGWPFDGPDPFDE
jgi:hypothetical protein